MRDEPIRVAVVGVRAIRGRVARLPRLGGTGHLRVQVGRQHSRARGNRTGDVRHDFSRFSVGTRLYP